MMMMVMVMMMVMMMTMMTMVMMTMTEKKFLQHWKRTNPDTPVKSFKVTSDSPYFSVQCTSAIPRLLARYNNCF